jgi:hypothetical protein
MARPRRRKQKHNTARDAHRNDPQGVHPETVNARLRELERAGLRRAAPRDALDPLAGFTLGQLLLRYRACPTNPGSINEDQYEAGQRWTDLAYRYAALMGFSTALVKSPSLLATSRGMSCANEPDELEIKRVKKLWSACHEAMMKVCDMHGRAVRDIIYAVCIENRAIGRFGPADYGNLRVGLNALAKALGITDRNGKPESRAWSSDAG